MPAKLSSHIRWAPTYTGLGLAALTGETPLGYVSPLPNDKFRLHSGTLDLRHDHTPRTFPTQSAAKALIEDIWNKLISDQKLEAQYLRTEDRFVTTELERLRREHNSPPTTELTFIVKVRANIGMPVETVQEHLGAVIKTGLRHDPARISFTSIRHTVFLQFDDSADEPTKEPTVP